MYAIRSRPDQPTRARLILNERTGEHEEIERQIELVARLNVEAEDPSDQYRINCEMINLIELVCDKINPRKETK